MCLITGLVRASTATAAGVAAFLIVLGSPCARAQGGPGAAITRPIDDVLHDYITAGLSSNLALNNQDLEVQRSLAVLAAARARYLPELSVNARYTRAGGGREFDVPAAELFNPVYSTLNQMLVAAGQPARFPLVSDLVIPFQLPREQDTRITLRQPLYAPAIVANAHAAAANAEANASSRLAYARALKRDITLAYLAWLRAVKADQIVASSIELLRENLRASEALLDSGRGTRDVALRARAELLDVQQQKTAANNGILQAQSYLNFLLNRPLSTALEDAVVVEPVVVVSNMPAAIAAQTGEALRQRPELQQLDQSQRAAAAQLRAAQAANRPTLSLGVDLGTTGAEYRFGPTYNYVVGSIVFNWTLFNGGATTAQIDQARLAAREVANQREQQTSQIELELQQARDALASASESLATAAARADAANAAFQIARRKRDEGAATQLEFFDARNQVTNAQLNLNLTQFELLRRLAEFEFAIGTPL